MKLIVQLLLEEFWVNNAFASLEYIREQTDKSVKFAFTEEFDDKFIEFRFVDFFRLNNDREMKNYEETKSTLKKNGFYIRTRKQEKFAFLYCNWTLVNHKR
ncbi:MAG: hypothetical protein BAJALOKI2v1_130024 [Promethearchaeota archaeon]|nr:MAG: hypothetical protein BAJALOKI2v1_130024 [Candidatus Lokiarchaeota archaeon]